MSSFMLIGDVCYDDMRHANAARLSDPVVAWADGVKGCDVRAMAGVVMEQCVTRRDGCVACACEQSGHHAGAVVGRHHSRQHGIHALRGRGRPPWRALFILPPRRLRAHPCAFGHEVGVVLHVARLWGTHRSPPPCRAAFASHDHTHARSPTTPAHVCCCRLPSSADPHSASAYPVHEFQALVKHRMCSVCAVVPAARIVYGDRHGDENPAVFCVQCYHALHYNKEGQLLYDDFEVFPYFHEYG